MHKRYENTLEVLSRLLTATETGSIVWHDDVNDWRTTEIGTDKNDTASYRFRYIEAGPQIGADPYMLELQMPFLNAGFFLGTEGYELLLAIHLASTGSPRDDGSEAVTFLNRNGL